MATPKNFIQPIFPATRLAYRLLSRILAICAVFVTVAATIYGYWNFYEQTAAGEKQLVEVQRSLLPPLADAVWALDDARIQLQLESIRRILPSAGIQLRTRDGKSYVTGQKLASNAKHTNELPISHPRSVQPLGTLSITIPPEVIRKEVQKRVMIDVLTLLGFALVISVAISFFVYHLIVRRLAILSRFAGSLDLNALDRSTLHLPVPAKKRDELDDLTDAIERMRQRISQDMLTASAMQRELRYQATHDPLTGLGNRSYLSSRAEHMLSKPAYPGQEVAFVFLDIDRFKIINDTLGHLVGDHLLRALADRIRQSLPPRVELFRPGSDEFLLLITEPKAHPSVHEIIQQLQESLTQAFEIEHHSLSVTLSVGVATAPENGTELSTLLKHTDIALQAAKQAGRNHACFFTPDLLANLNDQVKIETLLRGALDRNEFRLVFQPQINIETGAIIGTEALLRWENRELGRVPPDRFIPIAEDTGLIVPIGAWVLREAMIEWRRWRDQGLTIPLSVNLSAVQLRHAGIFETIRDICLEEALPPEVLELEVTESVLMDDVELIAGKLTTFRDMGIRIAVDDFGTGYSSLSYLKHLPIDRLKIDRSFISDLPGDPNDTAIAIAVIRLAQALNLEVIAEGVETAEQAALLLQEGCLLAQGYLYARPLPPDEFLAFAQATQAKIKAPTASSTIAG